MALDQNFAQDFPYVAMDADVQSALGDLGRRTGVTVRLDPTVRGNVSFDNSGGSVRSFLEEALNQTSATWWYDGVILYVEPQDGLTSQLVISQGLSLDAIRAELRTLDLLDDRFPLTSTGDGSVIRVIGPAGYVGQVRTLIETLINTRRARTGTPEDIGLFVPRVFHGRSLQ